MHHHNLPAILTAIGCAIVPAHAATILTGYTLGASSQLLTANGGTGSTLFHDSAKLGGNDASVAGTEAFNSVLVPGAGNWSVGQTVRITGVALTLVGGPASPVTQSGTFTFDIREAAGGAGASGGGGLSSLGTATATYTAPESNTAQVAYVNFDTPVSFVVDANSTTIGINFTSTSTIRYKTQADSGLLRYNHSNGNLVGGTTNNFQYFSVAGSVVPEPSIALAGSFGLLFLLRRRR